MTAPTSSEHPPGWLIVEDEALIALLIEDALVEMGMPVQSVANRVSTALEAVRTTSPAGAILDVHLAGEQVYPLAAELSDRKVPFLFLTGYGDNRIDPGFAGVRVLHKPFSVEEIQDAVHQLLA